MIRVLGGTSALGILSETAVESEIRQLIRDFGAWAQRQAYDLDAWAISINQRLPDVHCGELLLYNETARQIYTEAVAMAVRVIRAGGDAEHPPFPVFFGEVFKVVDTSDGPQIFVAMRCSDRSGALLEKPAGPVGPIDTGGGQLGALGAGPALVALGRLALWAGKWALAGYLAGHVLEKLANVFPSTKRAEVRAKIAQSQVQNNRTRKDVFIACLDRTGGKDVEKCLKAANTSVTKVNTSIPSSLLENLLFVGIIGGAVYLGIKLFRKDG